MPDTGLVPTMAMARAATVVNRNEMPATTARPAKAWPMPTPGTMNQKKQNTASRVMIRPEVTMFIGRSRCVRSTTPPAADLAAAPPAASLKAPRMMLRLFHTPIRPLIAIAPMPTGRTKLRKIMSVSRPSRASRRYSVPEIVTPLPRMPIIGVMTHHDRNEPQAMIRA